MYLYHNFDTIKEPVIIDWFNKNLTGYDVSLKRQKLLSLLQTKHDNNETYNEKLQRYLNNFNKTKTDVYYLKVKILHKNMDYNVTPISHFNALNLKYWDNKTMKTSNKHLKANDAYIFYNYDTNHKQGWVFGGITTNEIDNFCFKNGLDKKQAKKYKYGDFGNWILHTLV